MTCKVIHLGDGAGAIVCSRGQRARCSICKSRSVTRLCDYPVQRSGEEKTCDRKLCERCAAKTPSGNDYCPPHARRLAQHGYGRSGEGMGW